MAKGSSIIATLAASVIWGSRAQKEAQNQLKPYFNNPDALKVTKDGNFPLLSTKFNMTTGNQWLCVRDQVPHDGNELIKRLRFEGEGFSGFGGSGIKVKKGSVDTARGSCDFEFNQCVRDSGGVRCKTADDLKKAYMMWFIILGVCVLALGGFWYVPWVQKASTTTATDTTSS